MSSNYELLGYCGLFCGSCDHYRALFDEDILLLNKTIKKGIKIKKETCKGCRGDIEFIHQGCDICKIKKCAENKNLIHCGVCINFPCKLLNEFRNDERYIHHLDVIDNLKDLYIEGPINWLNKQEKNWKCECGKPYSWYDVKCKKCNQKLISYGNELKKSKKEI